MPELKCKICGTPTRYVRTELCGSCWELGTRIERNPELAMKMVNEVLKLLESDTNRKDLIDNVILDGICYECGSLHLPCYCHPVYDI